VETTFIYVLNDPRTGQIRYVGKADNPFRRWQSHCSAVKRRTHKSSWVLELRRLGLVPELEILEEVPYNQWEEIEREYIRVFRMVGIRLTNCQSGGEGPGSKSEHHNFGKRWKHSDEERAAKSLRMLGRKVSSDTCKKISVALTGKKLSPEHAEKCRKGGLGKTPWNKGLEMPEDYRKKLSLAHIGQPAWNKGMTGEKSPFFGVKKSPESIFKRLETLRKRREEKNVPVV